MPSPTPPTHQRLAVSEQSGPSSGTPSSSNDDARRRKRDSAPRHPPPPQRIATTNPAESTPQRQGRSPFSPASPPPSSSSPSVRNSLSSHASDMGRRLAQERSKNHALTRRVRELERTVASLKQGKYECTVDSRTCFASPPVASPIDRGTVDSSEKNGLHGMNRELEEEFQFEPRRRESAEKKGAHVFQGPESTTNNDSFAMSSDPSVVTLLEKASKLLSGSVGSEKNDQDNSDEGRDTINSDRTNSHQHTNHNGSAGPSTRTQERMHEYHELVTAFHAENECHGDIDGEELIPREDILWLFQELKWRFEDIMSVYAEETSKRKDESNPDNADWKECLEGLANAVEKAMKSSSDQQTNNHRGDRDTNHSSLATDNQGLRNEVSSLNQRLVSFATQHKETCRSLSGDMEAMKRDYQEQIAKKSDCIQNLETKISEQEEYIARIQTEMQKDKQWIQEEKQKLEMSKEGTSLRIQYLEGMLRTLQVELKGPRTPRGKKIGAADGTPVRSEEAAAEEVREMASPPVFMRDLASAMEDVAVIRHENHPINKPPHGQSDDGGGIRDALTPSSDGTELKKLIDQIATLGNSLADSETQRADLLDDFQAERKKYILQYKQMSGILKHLVEERTNEST